MYDCTCSVDENRILRTHLKKKKKSSRPIARFANVYSYICTFYTLNKISCNTFVICSSVCVYACIVRYIMRCRVLVPFVRCTEHISYVVRNVVHASRSFTIIRPEYAIRSGQRKSRRVKCLQKCVASEKRGIKITSYVGKRWTSTVVKYERLLPIVSCNLFWTI